MNSYRGIEFEVWGNGGYIVGLYGDEIYCETIEAVETVIDEYLDGDEF